MSPLESRTLLAADFAIAAFSDTQYVVEADQLADSFARQTAWIAAHKTTDNIAFFAHQGDMLRRGYSNSQADNAAGALANLDAAGVPYAVAIGNHDYDNQFDDLDRHVSSANFTSHFGDARYAQQLAAGSITEYGSSLDQRNHYHVFSAAGQQFLVLSVEWQAPTAARAWAQGVLDAHKNVPTILTTHEYLAGSAGSRTSGTPVDAALLGAVNGSQLWTSFVSPNDQIFMVLSGHTGANWSRTVTNAAGHTVIEAAADFESSQPNGGDGWLQTMAFTLGTTSAAGSLVIQNVRPGVNGGADTTGTSATYSINFAQRFAGIAALTPVVPPAPGANVAPERAGLALSTPESTALTFDPVAGATDADGDALKAVLTSLPPGGSLYVNNNGTFTYTPDPKFTGVDSFTYVLSDGKAVSAPVTVTVNVRPAAPVYYYPVAETTTRGTRTGSLNNLTASDNVVERLTEVVSSTNNDVEHRFQFNVTAGANLVLGINAWRTFSNPGTGDEYDIRVSTTGTRPSSENLVQLVAQSSRDVTRTRFDADEPYQLWGLPAGVIPEGYTGPIYVHIVDVNAGTPDVVDSLTIDEIFVRSAVSFPVVSVTAATDGAESPADDKPATFTVTRTGSGASIRNPLTVSFDLTGTATVGDDYALPATYAVTIPAGQTSATFAITPINDGLTEDAETITLALAGGDAYDVGAAGSATATVADYVPDFSPPSTPVVTVSGATSKSATITWAPSTDNVGVVGYDVFRDGALVQSLAGTGTSFTNTGLAPSTTYGYVVVARDAAGNSAGSATVFATTRLAGPANLAGTKLTGPNKGKYVLTWTDNSAVEANYRLYTQSPTGAVTSQFFAANTTTFTTAKLSGGTWRFWVVAVDATGVESDASNVLSVVA
ncbi:MAG TPA: cadherin-like domain-containing protein [Tepidisphaeraceae bacterium]|nr:cadherin-like domain-containing protein [Tepidisphaeraceae bacterium]